LNLEEIYRLLEYHHDDHNDHGDRNPQSPPGDKHKEQEHSARDRRPEDQVIMYNRWVEANVEEQQ
jgi:hypothetical protein